MGSTPVVMANRKAPDFVFVVVDIYTLYLSFLTGLRVRGKKERKGRYNSQD
jgi:hypothetical protein